MKRSVERVLATIGAATVLVVGANAISYAATGSSFLLGGSNTAKKVTTITNTGAGAVLNLHTKSTTSAPFTTNGKGLVGNLNSQYLGGKTLAQVQAGATLLNGMSAADIVTAAGNVPAISFKRTDGATQSYNFNGGATFPALASNAGAAPGTYDLTGTVTYACGDNTITGYALFILTWDGANAPQGFGGNTSLGATDCGKPIAVPETTVSLTSNLKIIVQVYGTNQIYPGPQYSPTTLTLDIEGRRLKTDL
jgi:hypothetical protein